MSSLFATLDKIFSFRSPTRNVLSVLIPLCHFEMSGKPVIKYKVVAIDSPSREPGTHKGDNATAAPHHPTPLVSLAPVFFETTDMRGGLLKRSELAS